MPKVTAVPPTGSLEVPQPSPDGRTSTPGMFGRMPAGRLLVGLFVAGVLLQTLFLYRGLRAWDGIREQSHVIGGDILALERMATSFVAQPGCDPYSKRTSGNGVIPGCVLKVLVGGSTRLAGDVRVTLLLIFAFHLVAGALMLATARQAGGDEFAVIYLAVFWLSPWRLFHGGFLWEPNFILLPAAVHAWCSWKSREQPRFVPSLVLGATLPLALQIHTSAVFLFVLTALLLLGRRLVLNPPGFVLGGVAGSLTLLPFVRAVLAGSVPAVPPDGFIGRGFVLVYPLLRPVLYWFRLGSLDLGRLHSTDSVISIRAALEGEVADRLVAVLLRCLEGLTLLSILVPVLATAWLLGRPPRSDRAKRTTEPDPWVRAYAVGAFCSLFVSAGLSSVTMQKWHALIALPAACLPVAAWLLTRRPFQRRWMSAGIGAFLGLRLVVALALAFDFETYCIVPEHIARWF